MALISVRSVMITAACAAMLAAGGCAKIRSYQGYVVDADLVNAIQPGVDNRESVRQTLGTPTFTGQFDQGEWYYFGRTSRNYAFNNPQAVSQNVLKIQFDDAGTVTAITREGMENVVDISPYGKETPTLGRDRSFFEDLFGNIGTVGAGAPPPQQQ